MKENEFIVVRKDGKTYLGRDSDELEEPNFMMFDVVEIVTTMSIVNTNVRKNVVIMGLDYNSGPVEKIAIREPSASYLLDHMSEKDRKALISDYKSFCSRDNLIQPPPTKTVLQ